MRDWVTIIYDSYSILYRLAGGDFDYLLGTAEINEQGEKVIPFMDYETTVEEFNETVNYISRKYKLKKWEKERLGYELILGCSPKFSDK